MGSAIAVIFTPLGFGKWQTAVATILGLLAKEEVVGVLGTLSGMEGDLIAEMESGISSSAVEIGVKFFDGSKLSAFSFMIFNLLCAPCFGAMGAIKREMNNWKWTAFAISYMTCFAYAVSFIVYQLGLLLLGTPNVIGTAIAFVVLAGLIFLIVRPYKDKTFKLKAGVR